MADSSAMFWSALDPFTPNPKKPWKATWWIDFFRKLGPQFPVPDAPEEVWTRFLAACSRVPFTLLALGVLVSLGVLCCSCLCKPGARVLRSRRPSLKSPALVGTAALILIVLGAVIYWRTGSIAWDAVDAQLGHALVDSLEAKTQGTKLRTAAQLALQALESMPKICQEKAHGILSDLRKSLDGFMAEVDQYWSDVDALPDHVRGVQQVSDEVSWVTRISLLVPLLLVLFCCFFVLASVLCSRRGRCSLRCVECIGPLLFVPTVLLVAAMAAAQLEVAVVSSSFCANCDSNTVAYVEHAFGASSVAANLTKYYLFREGNNPLLRQLTEASREVAQAQATLVVYGPAIERSCPDWMMRKNLSDSLASALEGIGAGQRLLSTKNVWQYYSVIVHENACRTAVIGLGWLILFQVVVGLALLPWLITVATHYLKARQLWAEQHALDRLIPGSTFRAEMRRNGLA